MRYEPRRRGQSRTHRHTQTLQRRGAHARRQQGAHTRQRRPATSVLSRLALILLGILVLPGEQAVATPRAEAGRQQSAPMHTVCTCNYEHPTTSVQLIVDNLQDLQNAINVATESTTILVSPGTYDLRTSPYSGSGIGIQVTNHDIVIRSETGQRDDVVFDAGGMANGLPMGFMISDYLAQKDSLRNITLADITIRNTANHLISVQGEFHPQNLTIHNVHLVNSGQQLIKVNPASLSAPQPSSNGTIACCRIEYETHLHQGWYTQGIDIHSGDHWIIRNNEIRNIRAHPESGAIGGFAILVWTNSVGTIVERNLIVDCDRGISFGDWSHNGAAFLDHTGGVIRHNVIKGYEHQNPEGSMGSYEGLALANTAHAVLANNTVHAPGDIGRGIDILGQNTRFNLIVNNITDKAITVRGGASTSANTFLANIEHANTSFYVDVANLDFHLAPGSPAIDAGAPYPEQCAELDCELVADDAPDVGADEVTGTPYAGESCEAGYPGGPVDPGELGDLFPPARPLPPYDFCSCDPLPEPPGALTDTLGGLGELQNLLYSLHVSGDERERTILLEDGDYHLGQSPFGHIHVYTSNLTIRSLSGDRDRVVLYGNHDSDYGIVLDNFGTRDIANVTLADLTIRDVARHAVQGVAYYNRQDDLLIHNVRLLNAGQETFLITGSATHGSSGVIECSLIERDSLRTVGWAATAIDIQHGDDWTIRNCVFRDIRAESGDPGDATAGLAIRAWNSSTGTIVERNAFVDCDWAVLYGDASQPDDHVGGVIRYNAVLGHAEERPDGSIGSGTAIRLSNCQGTVVLNNSLFAPSEPILPAVRIDQIASIANVVQNNIMDGEIGFTNGATPAANDMVTNLTGAAAGEFADVEGNDLHLAPGSTAINAGTAHDEGRPDIDCAPVSDDHPDIGADEFGASIHVESGEMPAAWLRLARNRPNPFHPATTILFTTTAAARVTLRIYDVQGRGVRTLVDDATLPAGEHRIRWDGRDENGQEVASGIYFYRVVMGRTTKVERMLRLR